MGKDKSNNVKGIRIRTINHLMAVITCVLCALLVYAIVQISMHYRDLNRATENYIASEKDATMINDGSDYLTDEVRLYAVTMDPQHVENYFREIHDTRRRDIALEELRNYRTSEEAYGYLQAALDYSNELVEREVYSMKMITTAMGYDLSSFPEEVQKAVLTPEDLALDREKMLEKGRVMVFDEIYQQKKGQIINSINAFRDSIITETREDQQSSVTALEQIMARQRIFILLLFVTNIITFVMILVLIVKPLQSYIPSIREEREIEEAGAYEFRNLAQVYNDVHEVNVANEALLRHKAEHDPLTGITNRGGFDKLCYLLKDKSTSIALLLIDVDNFKQINDTYGHEVGDQVLKKVAKLIQESFRAKDYPARIGGDEFAVIMTSITPSLESVIRNKVSYMNQALASTSDGLPPASISVGVAFSREGFTDGLYQNSDRALYLVKKNGRCGCEVYSGSHIGK